MNKIVEKIQKDELLKKVLPILTSGGRQSFLVGGFLRDSYLLDAPSLDYDIVVVKEGAKVLAQELAQELDGTLVELDFENNIYRTVTDNCYFDITSTKDILKDAKRRDFKLNSIYYNFNKNELFDPLDGLKDLQEKVLDTHTLENFKDDPLRMLRTFRFASLYGFSVTENILNYIKENKKEIQNSAKERLTYEIIKMFEGDNVVCTLKLAHSIGFLEELFPFASEIEKIPPNSHHHLNLLEHSIKTMENIRIKNPLLKLAALMHDIGKPALWQIEPCEVLDPDGNLITERHRFIGHEEAGAKLAKVFLEKMKFSRKQVEFITLMISNHIYPSALMQQPDKSEKSLIRFAKKISPYVKELLELARADRLSARGVLVSEEKVFENLENLEALGGFCEKIEHKLKTLPKLLDGNEIMAHLGISPSKKLGEIISELEEAQLSNVVQSKDDALRFIENYR